MPEKRGKGQPRAFENSDIFLNAVKAYALHCEDKGKLPNVAGFCVYADITRETYYKQKDYYSDTFTRAEDILEDGAINSDAAPNFKIFYMKNKFGKSYKDKVETEHSGTMEINTEMIEKYLKR
jgi:hypothetical protein